MDITGTSFDGIVAGGSAKNGQEIAFRMRCNGDEEMTVIADYRALQAAIATLASFCQMAASDRAKANPLAKIPGGFEQTGTLQMKGFRLGDPLDPSELALRLETTLGVPLDLVLPGPLALQLAEALRSHASRPPKSNPRRS
jgi:hypothetical protein